MLKKIKSKQTAQKMNKRHYFLLFILILCQISCDTGPAFTIPKAMYSTFEDSIKWSEKDIDDSDWITGRLIVSADEAGVWWARAHYTLGESDAPLGVRIISMGSYDVYWDGVKIGENGSVDFETNTEVHGSHIKLFLLPKTHTSPGNHILSLRIAYLADSDIRAFSDADVGDYHSLAQWKIFEVIIFHVVAGLFLLVGVYFLFLFFITNKELKHLVFSLLSISFFLLVILEFVKYYYEYPYPFQIMRLQFVGVLTTIIAILLPLFFIKHFEVILNKKLKYLYIILLFGLYGFLPQYDMIAIFTMIISSISSLCILLKANRNHKLIFSLSSIGLLVWAVTLVLNYDYMVFIGFAILLLLNLISLSLKRRDEQQLKFEIETRASRLELELLKINIQPHFLMNSMTAIIDWIEEDPKIGVRFLEALSNECHTLLEVSNKKQIPLETEIELCNAHLQVMGFRKEQNFKLEVNGDTSGLLIPPTIFLTCIENAFSHNLFLDNENTFVLIIEETKSHVTYKLESAGIPEKSVQSERIGTGGQYINARLQESYSDDWYFVSEEQSGHWVNELKVPL